MRGSYFILGAIIASSGVSALAEVVPPGLTGTSVHQVTFDAGAVALGAVETLFDWSSTSNLDALGADLLILDYQIVAMQAGNNPTDSVQLSVLTSDVRRDRSQGEVATRFFAPARHLWQGTAEISTSPAAAYDLPAPDLNLTTPVRVTPTSFDAPSPASNTSMGSLGLIGFMWN